jgi:serine/threonine-protein kinase
MIGDGALGTVYEGLHLATGRRVAVSILAGDDARDTREFQRDLVARGVVDSQYVAQVLDSGVDEAAGTAFIVMELPSGEGLDKVLERLAPLRPDVALRIVAQACLGLRRAHERGIIHRALKPSNLLLTRREADEIQVKLLGFAVAPAAGDGARFSSGRLSVAGGALDSLAYLSPEQVTGKELDARSDVWALGVILYEALCGKTPHAGCQTVTELVGRIGSMPAMPLKERARWVPAETAAIAHKALAIDPSHRFQTAAEMFDALRARLPAGHALYEADVRSVSASQAEEEDDDEPPMTVPPEALTPAPAPDKSAAEKPSADVALLAQALVMAASMGQKAPAVAATAPPPSVAVAPPRRSWTAIAVIAASLAVAELARVGASVAHDWRTPAAPTAAPVIAMLAPSPSAIVLPSATPGVAGVPMTPEPPHSAPSAAPAASSVAAAPPPVESAPAPAEPARLRTARSGPSSSTSAPSATPKPAAAHHAGPARAGGGSPLDSL